MPRHDPRTDWDDDFDEADEEWNFAARDADGNDLEPTVPCPYCRREIYEDAERCPYCERYISDEDAPPERKPWWIVLGTIACLYLVYRWIVG